MNAMLRSLWVVSFMLCTVSLSGCDDAGQHPGAASSGTPAGVPVSAPVASTIMPVTPDAPVTPEQPLPYLTLSLRDAVDDAIEVGVPLRVAVRLEAPETGESVELAPGTGTWADAIHVELWQVGAATPAATTVAIGTPATPSATLAPGRAAAGLWRFPLDATRALAPGDYEVRARLAISDGTGWNGNADAEPVPLTLLAATDDPARDAQRALAKTQDALLDGRVEEAAGLIDALLHAQPDNYRAWILRSVISERAGNPVAAMIAVNQARLHYSALQRDEPDIDIEMRQTRLVRALVGTDANAANVDPQAPLWSWPPNDLLQRPDAAAEGPPAETITAAAAPPTSTAAPVAPSSAAAPTSVASVETPAASAPGTLLPWDSLKEPDILKDPHGQWASAATASTQYRPADYAAQQATGAPDVNSYSDNPKAWTPSASERQREWLALDFPKAVHATEVRVRQSFNPGTIVSIEAYDETGAEHPLWADKDTNVYANRIAWFAVRFDKTAYAVKRVKITLDTPAAKGWKQIDAVQLVGEE